MRSGTKAYAGIVVLFASVALPIFAARVDPAETIAKGVALHDQVAAVWLAEDSEAKTDGEKLAVQLSSFLASLSEESPDAKASFARTTYVPFFQALHQERCPGSVHLSGVLVARGRGR